MTLKYYSLKKIKEKKCKYNLIYGQRSNGKTFAVIQEIMERYTKSEGGECGLYLRRWEVDIKGQRAKRLCDGFLPEHIKKFTKGQWEGVKYYNREWFFTKYDKDNDLTIVDNKPFMISMCLTSMEHDKGPSYPRITTILFDEFITRPNSLGGSGYAVDEFVLFCNVLSTVIRLRTNVTIYLVGNTINKYCPYFREFGIEEHIPKQKQGTIDIYTFGNGNLTMAVEYCKDNASNSKSNNIYFAFDNPKLNMIKSGEWELEIYPHIIGKIPTDWIKYKFFVEFNGNIITGNICVGGNNLPFVYFHNKTTPLKLNKYDLIYNHIPNQDYHYRIWIDKGVDKMTGLIADLYRKHRFFYSDNLVGEIISNYIAESP